MRYGRRIDGYCTRRCDDDDHCPLTYDCHNNWCMKIPQPIGAACDTDIECASEACADQTCVQYCEAHSECPEGYGCDDSGRCAEGLSRLGGEEGTRLPVAVPSPLAAPAVPPSSCCSRRCWVCADDGVFGAPDVARVACHPRIGQQP